CVILLAGSVPHVALPSFPTRRSSDLYAMREIIASFPVYRTYVNGREPDVSAHDRRYIEYAVSEAKRRNPRHPSVVFDFVRGLLLDRKSTRLNSSHLVISYAVFCLKKK